MGRVPLSLKEAWGKRGTTFDMGLPLFMLLLPKENSMGGLGMMLVVKKTKIVRIMSTSGVYAWSLAVTFG